MEIYIDKAQGKAVIVADLNEIGLMETAEFWATKRWYDKNLDDKIDGWRADLNKQVGDAHAKIGQQLAKAEEELKQDHTIEHE